MGIPVASRKGSAENGFPPPSSAKSETPSVRVTRAGRRRSVARHRVQAQDYLGAKWAVGLRTKSITDGDVERAFDEGAILRTHVLRPTCHFVAPEDIRWMLALTAPRIRAANAYTYRKYELDRDVFRRSRKTLERALRGGKERTRSELASALRREGVAAEGIRLAALMIEAELEGVVVSGPRRGRRFTYALLEERAPQGAALPREEALAELTRRYFSSHGPATLSDYAWWSGLTMGDAKRGIEVVEPALAREDLDGRAYWFVQSKAPAERASTSAHLLPNYDEYLIAYKDRGPVTGASARDVFSHSLVIDGRLAGNWRRTLRKDSVLADVPSVPAPQSGGRQRPRGGGEALRKVHGHAGGDPPRVCRASS